MKQTIQRPHSWVRELIVLAEAAVIVLLWYLALKDWGYAVCAGALTFLTLAAVLRGIFLRHHRQGMRQLRRKNYREAAAAFQKSQDFFEKHPIIDRLGMITMLSTNAFPYRQMALNNLGLCLSCTGDPQAALAIFQTLQTINPKFPNIQKAIDVTKKLL